MGCGSTDLQVDLLNTRAKAQLQNCTGDLEVLALESETFGFESSGRESWDLDMVLSKRLKSAYSDVSFSSCSSIVL